MNIKILKRASSRGPAWRKWKTRDGVRVFASAPSRSAHRWFYLGWSVSNGERGLDVRRYRKLSRAVARDLIRGTDKTGMMRPC